MIMDTTFIKTSLPRDFIYEFRIDKNLTESYKNDCLAADIKYHPTVDRPNATEYGFPIIYNEKLFDCITKCVQKVGDEYFTLPKETKLKLHDVWITRTNLMKNGIKHFHSFSIFSGLLYLDNSNIETIFTIEDEFMRNFNKMFWGITKPNVVNTMKVKPEIGKLLIWPSYVVHNISTNNTKDTRYTLAFNTFFDGILSTKPTNQFKITTHGPEFL